MAFRQAFKSGRLPSIRWFPGHMNRSMRQLQLKLKYVDCIVEVHDCRVPVSGRNPEFQRTVSGGVKPYILAMNKKDLTEKRDQRRVQREFHEAGIKNVLFTCCKDQSCKGVRELVPLASKLIATTERYNRAEADDYTIMIIGVPNVGKSSLVNILRNCNLKKKAATAVGALPGVTRSVLEKIKISENPLLYMIDTPGILEPLISHDEMGLKLALVNCIPDHVVGEEVLSDYLLYWLNSHKRFEYVSLMGLTKASDNITEVLLACAERLGAQRHMKQYDGQIMKVPDLNTAAKHFLKLFRKGFLGKINLDIDK